MTAGPMAWTFEPLTDPAPRRDPETDLRERAAVLARLSTAIAHEVRLPLAAIRASLRPLQREEVPAAEVRASAADIARQVARLDRTVSDVLELARPLRVDLAPVDVAALVWDAAGTIPEGWEGPHVRFALEASAGTIVTDGERLRGVLASLVGNAREAVRAAGRCDAVDGIEIGARRVASCRLLLWVEDRGAGVPAADLPHVFEPFFTTSDTGTGLGLALARKVVEALGGTIRMKSREGEGKRVEIELPVSTPPLPSA